jgi:hypothetical protein
MIVLERDAIAIYHRDDNSFRLRTKASPPPGSPLPRDVRGRLVIEGETVRAYLAGMLCRLPLSGDNFQCDDRSGDWPLEAGAGLALPASLVNGRNYFTAPPLPPFYTAARWPAASRQDLWILATTAGPTQMFDTAGAQLASLGDWGSEIAAIDSVCSGERFLVSPVAGVNPAPLPGRLAALWPAEQPGALTAVVHSPDRYAAYRVSLACGR